MWTHATAAPPQRAVPEVTLCLAVPEVDTDTGAHLLRWHVIHTDRRGTILTEQNSTAEPKGSSQGENSDEITGDDRKEGDVEVRV